MPLVYATIDNLVDYAPEDVTIPSDREATRLLTSASKEIRRATKTAIYDVDTDGYPTNATIRQAFRDATCAQALWWSENPGEETGQADQFQSVSIGSVSLSRGGRGNSGSTSSAPRLSTQAETELRDAGVLTGSIVQSYTWENGWV